jgi:AraC family transcriptional regulator
MSITRRPLFESETLQIGLFEARAASDACGDVEWQKCNVVVLPFGGVFAKHDAPGRHVIGTPSHAVFIAADTPYRLSFPGAIGDRALIFRFDEASAPEPAGRRGDEAPGSQGFASHGLLPSNAIMLRNLLWSRLQSGEVDCFESEALGLDLLGMALRAMRSGSVSPRRSALNRRMTAVARVKEAIALAPADKWSVAKLANIANLSPFHLCRVFRRLTGTSLHDYVLRERLAQALDAVLDGGDDITTIALDAGFASHSHFTARFRSFFHCTPAAFRRLATAQRVGELRKIVTAPRSELAVD